MKTWKDVIEQHEDEIKEAMREADILALEADDRIISGWTVDVLIDRDGEISVTDYRSRDTITEAEFKGNTKCLYTAEVSVLDGENLLDYGRGYDEVDKWVEAHEVTEDDEYEYEFYSEADSKNHYFDEEPSFEVETICINEYVDCDDMINYRDYKYDRMLEDYANEFYDYDHDYSTNVNVTPLSLEEVNDFIDYVNKHDYWTDADETWWRKACEAVDVDYDAYSDPNKLFNMIMIEAYNLCGRENPRF